METLKRKHDSTGQDLKHKKKSRPTKLTGYTAYPITYYRRQDCENGVEDWMPRLLSTIPNEHKKDPTAKARTPNVAIDNLCLFKNQEDQLCTILGFYDKEFKGKSKKGFCLSGGHVEYYQDVDLEHCAKKELKEEFGINPEDIIETVPVGLIDDAFRDERNRYVTMTFAHWINGPPQPSDEHKILKIIPISIIKNLLETGDKIQVDENGQEEYGFVHGHDGILAILLKDANVLRLCKDIESSK